MNGFTSSSCSLGGTGAGISSSIGADAARLIFQGSLRATACLGGGGSEVTPASESEEWDIISLDVWTVDVCLLRHSCSTNPSRLCEISRFRGDPGTAPSSARVSKASDIGP